MNLLLDTHTFIWFSDQRQSTNLPQATKELLEDAGNTVFLSLASAWELAIKVSIGKISLAMPVIRLVEYHQTNDGIIVLPIKPAHIEVIETLPLHHKDPFDRLLVAQAQVEGWPIVSADPALDKYGVNRIWLE